MHDALRAYEPDTVVVDPDIEPTSRPTVRGRTEQVVVHVLHAGRWHRRMPDLSATACDQPYHSQFAPVRREALQHPLCPLCFTLAELARADAAEAKKRA